MPKQAGWLTQYSVRLRINVCTAKLDVDDYIKRNIEENKPYIKVIEVGAGRQYGKKALKINMKNLN